MDHKRYHGFYTARVTEVDPEGLSDYGAIRVSLPDFMVEDIGIKDDGSSINLDTDGLIAYPANNPLGGRDTHDTVTDEHFYQGSVYIPPKGSVVWIFFLNGDLERPFYWNAVNQRYSKLPPEQTTADEPHKVFTLLKTHQGRTICVSDDENTQRIEITGKKRTLTGKDPAGNDSSTYTIDGNMTTILFDERDSTEKLLIRTRLGDYIHVDIDERQLHIDFASDINIKTGGNFSLDVGKNIYVKSADRIFTQSASNTYIKSESHVAITGSTGVHLNSDGKIRVDGSSTFMQSGIVYVARPSVPVQPIGGRND
jgi:hypothetical protein